jgi:hypothetical protein
MVDPSEFNKMIDWAFVRLFSCLASSIEGRSQIVATGIYGLIACAGYLMFGNSVSQEVRTVHSPACH